MVLTVALAGGSVVDVDATVVVQLGCFLVLFLILRPLLFRPLLAVLMERERCTEGDVKEAKRRQIEAEDKMRRYERELQRIREKASAEREKLRDSGRAREREILDKARLDVNDNVSRGRQSMQDQTDQVRAGLDREVRAISRQIVEAVLGRKAA